MSKRQKKIALYGGAFSLFTIITGLNLEIAVMLSIYIATALDEH